MTRQDTLVQVFVLLFVLRKITLSSCDDMRSAKGRCAKTVLTFVDDMNLSYKDPTRTVNYHCNSTMWYQADCVVVSLVDHLVSHTIAPIAVTAMRLAAVVYNWSLFGHAVVCERIAGQRKRVTGYNEIVHVKWKCSEITKCIAVKYSGHRAMSIDVGQC